MSFEIGQRVLFRSLQWEVADTSSETFVELFGRSEENRGRRMRVLLGLDGASIERAEIPPLRWTIGELGWDVRQWKALHDQGLTPHPFLAHLDVEYLYLV